MIKIFNIKNTKFLVIFLFGLLGLSYPQKLLAQNYPPSFRSSKNNVVINSKEFGVRIIDSQGRVNFFRTNTVPLKPGDAYGWRMKINNYQSNNGKIKLREVLRLPSHPEMWKTENSDKFYISKDGKVATSIKSKVPVNGMIQNFWTITPGDPLGKYQIEVYINDELVEVFRFEVVPF